MYAEVRGARVRYERYGSGPRRLLLLHGWGGGVDSFAPFIRGMGDGCTMLVPEMPGHGLSSEPPEPWSVTEYAEAASQLLERTGFGPCGVVAHSFGGRIALLLAAERPDLVDAMLLTGAAGIPPKPSGKKTARQRLYRALRGAASLPILPAKTRESLREGLVQRFGSADYRALTPSMRATFNRVIGQDLTPVLGRVRVPVFLFWGEDDTETPLWMGQTMAREIPDAALTAVPGCGHFAYLEQGARFQAIARALFLQDGAQRGESGSEDRPCGG